jgi:hypothetical protein
LGAGIGYFAPEIGSFLGSSFNLFNMLNSAGKLVAVSVTGADIAAVAGVIGAGYLFSKIDVHGLPNSQIKNGGSYGEYDENGNLSYRVDTDHPHYIKELGDYYRPHTHYFKWQKIKNIWRYVERVLPR